MRALVQVYALSSAGCLPALEELHLCKNHIINFDLHNSSSISLVQQLVSGAVAAPTAAAGHSTAPKFALEVPSGLSKIRCFPELQFLNLDENDIHDWGQVERLSELPKCVIFTLMRL